MILLFALRGFFCCLGGFSLRPLFAQFGPVALAALAVFPSKPGTHHRQSTNNSTATELKNGKFCKTADP
ncbi:hypothetical protein, partial [Morococcus cerebrosus]|uniref:hypothetical protein n=1 Tax=Morococcus cerebrosus TaxID=1056807 RepID=UPI001ADF3925